MNKAKLLFPVFLFLSLALLFSCEQLGLTKEEKKPEKEHTKVQKKKKCTIVSMKFDQEVDRDVVLTYVKGKPATAVTTIKLSDTEKQYEIRFEYDTTGNLARLVTLPDNLVSNYVYNESGLPVEIKSDALTLQFSYNDKKQIIRQSTVRNGEIFQFNEYEYDEKGVPVVCNRFDRNSKMTSSIRFEYDNKKNPFKNLSSKINQAERIYGYAVGNFKHNPIKVTTTYHEKTKCKVHGQFKNPGDTDVIEISYEYNEEGYPVKYQAINDIIGLSYDCKQD